MKEKSKIDKSEKNDNNSNNETTKPPQEIINLEKIISDVKIDKKYINS